MLTIVLLLSAAQAAGLACVVCGGEFTHTVAGVPVGRSTLGAPVYACAAPCVQWYRSAVVGPASTGGER
ncbi:hypothetical protein ACWGCW_03200 [Streptomyces sp. NPDC054933]